MRVNDKIQLGLNGLAAATLIALMPATPSEAAELRLAAKPIEGQYIVVLTNDAADLSSERSKRPKVAAVATEIARAHRAKLARSYDEALRGFVVRADDDALARLLADPRVDYVEEDGIVQATATQTSATRGIDRIDQRNLPLSGTYTFDSTASTVHAYIIDTGIRATHTNFGGRVSGGATAINDGRGTADCNGHGTHVAGTVGSATFGVAKAVRLHPVRVLDCTGSGSISGVIAGIDWVTSNHVKPAVANMSLGGGASTALDTAVNNSINAGVTYAVAAGNDNVSACTFSPARVAAALTAASSTTTDARSSFSNWGPCVDLFAPGSSITSTWSTGDTAINTISGTSMASPHIAGVAALFLAVNPTATPSQVNSAIINASTPNKITSANGSPNRLLHSFFTNGGVTTRTLTNGTDVTIPDLGTAESPISVTGRTGNAPTSSQVAVDIRHTFRGDLVIDLVAPDGSLYRLKNSSSSDGADNVISAFTVNLSSEAMNGTWKLRVRDVFAADTGFINSWSLTF